MPKPKFASLYDARWNGYRTKTADLLRDDLAAPRYRYGHQTWQPVDRDGEWYKLGQIANVGAKFLRWMVDNGVLERRRSGISVEALKHDWYRVRPKAEWYRPDDFGDLWVPD